MSLSRLRIRKPRHRRRYAWAAVFLLLLGTGIYYSAVPMWEAEKESLGSYLTERERKQPPPPPVFTPGLTVKEFAVKTDPSGNRVVTGVLRNGGRVAYPYAEVRMNLLDVEGKLIGSAVAPVRNLRPGRSAAFTAPASVPDVTRVTVAEIRGFR